jgi:elongation factor 1-gamma
MSNLRIFSYLPNPRIWKATIVARLTGVELEIRGATPKELSSWLWDFDARPLLEEEKNTSGEVRGRVGFKGGLHKTEAFFEAHPFGTVPAAFSSDGKVGIFESNSIIRAVARLGESKLSLYGRDLYEASRIDSFLDASLVFARDSQIYLLSLGSEALSGEIHSRMCDAFATYLAGINQALSSNGQFIVGDRLTLADICFVAELGLFHNERARAKDLERKGLKGVLSADAAAEFPLAMAHFARLSRHPAFAPDVIPYLQKIEQATTTAQ